MEVFSLVSIAIKHISYVLPPGHVLVGTAFLLGVVHFF